MNIKVPNLGDGIDNATVLDILVKPGDTVSKEQTILELETDKAVAPLPAPEAGVIKELLIESGVTVSEGKVIAILESNDLSDESSDSTPDLPAKQSPAVNTSTVIQQPLPVLNYQVDNSDIDISTSPTIKRIASLIGLDLKRISPTGRGNRITLADVNNYVSFLQAKAFQSNDNAVSSNKPTISLPDFSKWGKVDEKPASSLRKKIAEKLTQVWVSSPHVTQFHEVDITSLMKIRKQYNAKFKEKGTSLTVTVFCLKALVDTLKEFPIFNSSFDLNLGNIYYKNYFHIGVAVDTEAGLIVPVIKDVDKKNVLELSSELTEIASKARERSLKVDDLQGGTFTISNLGGLGAGLFTPLINGHEVAILGLSRATTRLVKLNNSIEERLIMPFSVSYDHRVIDGADGARFVSHLEKSLNCIDENLIKESF